jgi:hypothetical protein
MGIFLHYIPYKILIIRAIKLRWIKWAYGTHEDVRSAYEITVGETSSKETTWETWT